MLADRLLPCRQHTRGANPSRCPPLYLLPSEMLCGPPRSRRWPAASSCSADPLTDITSHPPSTLVDKVSLARGKLRGPHSAPPETRWSGAPCFASRRLLALRVRRILTHQVAHEAPSTRAHEPEDRPLPKTRQRIECYFLNPRAEPQKQRSELSGGGLPWPPVRSPRLKVEAELDLLPEAEDGEHRLAAGVDGQHFHASVRPCDDQPE